jgi:AraC family transcriptional regulator
MSEQSTPVPLFPTSILQIPGDATAGSRFYTDPHVEIACRGRGQRILRVGHADLELGTSKGMIELYREGYEIAKTRWQGEQGECIAITFPRSSTERLLHDDNRGVCFSTAHGVFNSQISRLGYELANEYRRGLPNGALYSEGISIALLGLIIREYASDGVADTRSVGLSVEQKRTICDLIDSELGSDLSVERMARLFDMSAYQFSRRFKSCFGTSPHQYILLRRVDAAVSELQRNRGRSIAEIALEFGFSNQAHLTSAVRKHLGTTPSRARWS